MLSHPETARKGNLVAAGGMLLAIFGTIILHEHSELTVTKIGLIIGGLAIGTIIGWIAARKVKMTAMPEMVSLFNGMGGACAALISLIEYHSLTNVLPATTVNIEVGGVTTSIPFIPTVASAGKYIAIVAGLIIGSVSFAGSIVAFMKLNGTL